MKVFSLTAKFTLTSLLTLVVSLITVPVFAAGTLNVYNWAEYIGETTIADFEKEFGIKVTYDNYDSVETADAKLLAGSSGYDVVSHSGAAIGRLIPAGIILQPLERRGPPSQLRQQGMRRMCWYGWPFPELVSHHCQCLIIKSFPESLIINPSHLEKRMSPFWH